MRARKLILLTLLLTLMSGSIVYADTLSQKIKLFVNKQEITDAAIFVDGKAYISARSITDKLQALLFWDDANKNVKIFKPNVHMLTSTDNIIFGSVDKKRVKFNTFIQVDSLKVDITALKLTITDPYGDEKLIESRKLGDNDFPEGKSDFWITMKDISHNFDYAGTYTLRFWVKSAGDSSFQVVSEKTITCK